MRRKSPASLHLDRKRPKLVYREELLVFMQGRQNPGDFFQLLSIFGIRARKYPSRLLESIALCTNVFRNRTHAYQIAVLRLIRTRESFETPRCSVDTMQLRGFVQNLNRSQYMPCAIF